MSANKTSFFMQGDNIMIDHSILMEITIGGESVNYLVTARTIRAALQLYKKTIRPFVNMPGTQITFGNAADLEQSDKIYASIFIDVDEDLLEVFVTNYTSEKDRSAFEEGKTYKRYVLSEYLNML